MILKAKERGDGRQLGFYLLKTDTNEHVQVHDLRGFVADDLPSALHEIDLISRGTKAQKYLFSMSLNPPQDQYVRTETFEAAIEAIETKLGLTGQPRVIVFHEKDGRRHAHAVWSRIDAAKMRAINLAHYKLKLRDVARELFLENGWQMPRGFVNSKERDPLNYTLAEWQQAKRAGVDPKALKALFQECWAASDSGKAFASALKSRGYTLARGDRRGVVAVDYRGEVYGVARCVGVKVKAIRARIDEGALPSVEEAKAEHVSRMTAMVQVHVSEIEGRQKEQTASLAQRLHDIRMRQRQARDDLRKVQEARQAAETKERSELFRRGVRGLWDRLTGKHSTIRRQNERETTLGWQRDQAETDALIFRQRDERQLMHGQIRQVRQTHAEQVVELHRDIAGFRQSEPREPSALKEIFQRREANHERPRRRKRNRGPEFER